MSKIQDVLEPGEQLIKESSSGHFTQVTYVKSLISNTQGRLMLTSRRLIFLPGNFQATDATILMVGRLFKSPESVHIYLSSITKVEKGWGEMLAIHADKKYDFRGMTGASEWATAIEKARASPPPVRSAPEYKAPPPAAVAPVPYSPPPPPPMAGGGVFCPGCGQSLGLKDRFCPNCGSPRRAQACACPRCGNSVSPEQRFCNSCGAQLK